MSLLPDINSDQSLPLFYRFLIVASVIGSYVAVDNSGVAADLVAAARGSDPNPIPPAAQPLPKDAIDLTTTQNLDKPNLNLPPSSPKTTNITVSEYKEPPIPAVSLFQLAKKVHPDLSVILDRTSVYVSVSEMAFPNSHLTELDMLTIGYTEGAFASKIQGSSLDTGLYQTIPSTALWIFEKMAANPQLKSTMARMVGELPSPKLSPKENERIVKEFNELFKTNPKVSAFAGVAYMSFTKEYVNARLIKSGLASLPPETANTLFYLSHNKNAVPWDILKAYLDDPETDHNPENITWDKLEKKLDQLANLRREDRLNYGSYELNPETANLIKLYARRASLYSQAFQVAQNLSGEGKIQDLPTNFPEALRKKVEQWVKEDMAQKQVSAINTSDRSADLVSIIKGAPPPTPTPIHQSP